MELIHMTATDWQAWEFLLGDWVAAGSGEPGQGSGTVSFSLELDGRILVRRNHLDFAATKDAAAFVHDDLLITFREENGEVGAIYFDNEGHTIHYKVALQPDGSLVHVSDEVPGAPRFRMTYIKDPGGTYITRFEIAPPGNPQGFVVHVEGPARRK